MTRGSRVPVALLERNGTEMSASHLLTRGSRLPSLGYLSCDPDACEALLLEEGRRKRSLSVAIAFDVHVEGQLAALASLTCRDRLKTLTRFRTLD